LSEKILERSSEKVLDRLPAAISLVLFLVLILAWIAGARTGVQLEEDAYRLQATFQLLGQGIYHPSRTSGYPAFELIGGAIYQLAGVAGVTVLSGISTLLAAGLLVLAMRGEPRLRGAASVFCVLASPLVLTSESQIIETSFLLLWIAALIYALSKLESHKPSVVFAVFAFVSLMLVLSRPDAVLLCLSTVGAFLISAGRDARARAASYAVISGALCAVAATWIMAKRFPFSTAMLLNDSLLTRIQKTLIRTFTMFNGVGLVALSVCLAACAFQLVALLRRMNRQPTELIHSRKIIHRDPIFLTAWLLGTAALYLVRYAALPDQFRYLLPLLIVLSAAIGWMPTQLSLARNAGMVALVMVLTTTFFTTSLTRKTDPWQPRPEKYLTVSAGGFAQDLSARQARKVRSSSLYKSATASMLQHLGLNPTDIASTPLQAFLAMPEETIIVPQDQWSQWTQPGLVASWFQEFQETPPIGKVLVGCNEVTFFVRSGWRSSQPATSYLDTILVDRHMPLNCGVIGKVEKTGVLLYPFGARHGHHAGELISAP
jgi:hypothetical protein